MWFDRELPHVVLDVEGGQPHFDDWWQWLPGIEGDPFDGRAKWIQNLYPTAYDDEEDPVGLIGTLVRQGSSLTRSELPDVKSNWPSSDETLAKRAHDTTVKCAATRLEPCSGVP